MSNATIDYKINLSNRLNDKIEISFKKKPDTTLTKALISKGFNSSKSFLKWIVTVGELTENTYQEFYNKLQKGGFTPEQLSGPYYPAAESCTILDTIVPDSMDYEIHQAVNNVKEAVGGSLTNFIKERLKYTDAEICKSLSAEQVDAVAMCIYNIEKGQAMIIGDQTGIGKGRVAAAIIRYAHLQGLQPIFLTEKPNLFSDIYRDLAAIGSADLVPFIINSKDPKTHVKDENGNIIYQALPPTEQERIFKDQVLPKKFQYVVATYSQFNSSEKKPLKPAFLSAIAQDNILIMDESHNASGSSNTGEFMQKIAENTRGITFLSATFAKRPDNMPIYAMKTAMSEANMSKEDLITAIQSGGVALQEIVASQLVEIGQMIRRERSFEGVEVNYFILEEYALEHKAIADNVTAILRGIIGFQKNYVDQIVDELDEIAAAEGKEMEIRKGASQAGIDNIPYFSKVFNVINQMLFSIKAEAVADKALNRLKEGKKPVIAFSSTMGSFLESMENDMGQSVSDGDTITADFTEVLKRGLDGILRYTEKDINGNAIHKKFEIGELPPEGQQEYNAMLDRIKSISSGITISPIDVIVQKIEAAGYSVAEVTGRKLMLQLNKDRSKGLVLNRKKENTNDAFRRFNNNEADVLLINQAGSTGASAHAIVTDKVPYSEVKQRVMIVLQAELDINREVQKRGRVNRTGQILKPIYDYVNSAIPAEMRLMMMLQKKLKSLDANTTSNQKQSTKILDVNDFLNKYGDKVVLEYLKENPELNDMLNDPLSLSKDNGESSETDSENAAHKVSGRVAVLSTDQQEEFYREISERYEDYVEYLKQAGEYDLEVETMNLEAETISKQVLIVGKGGDSAFGKDSYLEKVYAKVLRKPFSKLELDNLIAKEIIDTTAKELQILILKEYDEYTKEKLLQEIQQSDQKYKELIANVASDKRVKNCKTEKEAYQKQKELIDGYIEANEKNNTNLRKSSINKASYLQPIFKFFSVGQGVYYPFDSFGGENKKVKAVFIGFIIDKKKKNPYAPSAIKLKFAFVDSNRYIALPASTSMLISAIKGESSSMNEWESKDISENWEKWTKESNVNRNIRYIITGNLLQAFGNYSGKLVSYTLIDGGVKKGILLPEYWSPEEQVKGRVVVPVIRALMFIKSLPFGSIMNTDDSLSFIHTRSGYRIAVPASNKRGGRYYLNQDILKLVENNNFNKQSDQMVAELQDSKIDAFVKILQEQFGSSVTLSQSQFEMIRDTLPKEEEEKKVIKSELIYLEAKLLNLVTSQYQQAAGVM